MPEYIDNGELGCWLYEPENVRDPNRLLICVHGISRNAREQLEAFRPLADAQGIRMLAPDFSLARYPGYQRLAQQPGHNRADLALNRLLLQLQKEFMSLKLDLFGYSGGAQFCHRYALCYPQRIRSMILASAGWYTFPDADVRFPRGLANWPQTLPQPAGIHTLLAIPTMVMVGSQDTLIDSSLRSGEKIDQQQGRTRLERAYNWFRFCRSHGEACGWHLAELDAVGHSFADSINHTNLLELSNNFLELNRRSAI